MADDDEVERLMGQIISTAQTEMQRIVDESTVDLKTLCSIPVGYSGHKVIRSKPGEAPRQETGGYIASITGDVKVDGETVTGEIGSDLPLSQWLNEGTGRMAARPHNQTIEDQYAPTIEDRLANAINADTN